MKVSIRSVKSRVAKTESAQSRGGSHIGVTRIGRSARAVAGSALAATLVAFGAIVPAASASAPHTVRIVIGGGTDFTDASLYHALAQLEGNGINVQLSNLADPASALEAVVSGKSDIYVGDPMEAAVAVAVGAEAGGDGPRKRGHRDGAAAVVAATKVGAAAGACRSPA